MIKSGCGVRNDRPSFARDATRLGDKFQAMLADLPFRMYRKQVHCCDTKLWGKVRFMPTNETKNFLKVSLNETREISGFESIEIGSTVFKVKLSSEIL